jgi:hypothetical protein
MKIKTSELTGHALDWAVEKAQNTPVSDLDLVKLVLTMDCYKRSTDWAQGGPIIEREGIWTRTTDEGEDDPSCLWRAELPYRAVEVGPTQLIAAMRCYVASELGDEVDVPDELGS